MTTLSPTPSPDLTFSPEAVATAFLVGFSSKNTRAAYKTDLGQFHAWLERFGVEPFDATKATLDLWARDLEQRCSKATVARKLAAVSGFYTYAQDAGYIDRNPCDNVRRPKPDETSATALDHFQLRALLDAARRSGPRNHALVLLLALNGLRASEALGADADGLSVDRGHRVLHIVRKGGKERRVPLAPVTAEAIDTYLAGRTEGPLFTTVSGRRLDRKAAWSTIRSLARRAGLEKVSPHVLRHAFATLCLQEGAELWVVQDACDHRDPKTTMIYNRRRHQLDNHPTYLLASRLA